MNLLKKSTRAAIALLAGATVLLAGCASTDGIKPTHTLADASRYGGSAGTTPWPAANWWSEYGDTDLDRLIDQAIAGQPTLKTVQARLQLAQSSADAANAERYPRVDGSLDMTDQRISENGIFPPPLAGSTVWINQAQVTASWDLDLFGRQRAALDSSIGQVRAAEADIQAARVQLASSVALAYFNLAGLIEAREVAIQSQQQREQVLAITRQRIAGGLDTVVDLRQAEGLVAQSRVEIEALGESIGRARHALAELTGQNPQALDTFSPTLAAARAHPLPQTLPADLLGRRADLVAQRWRVESALRDVDVARAEFYPNVNLTAFIGLSSLGLDRFLDLGSRIYGAGPAVRLPIFDAGRLRANLSAKSAGVDVAVEGYNGALLHALREVADELTSLQSIERQRRAQEDATFAADAAFELARQRYEAGLGNFLVVLTAQTNVLTQRRAATDLKARQLASEVALNRALGGGYAIEPGAPAPIKSASR
ncbi:MAG TPA: efflux transporter outer membrane subunit [Burkholderiaceae bacterium]|nr:efflux transporter outer membrane subunit [Burkholderiaceae bacterium]